jgi:hypothetical protein
MAQPFPSRSRVSILCEGAVCVLSICCRSRSPTSSQIARQCLLLIQIVSTVLIPRCEDLARAISKALNLGNLSRVG